MELKEPKSKTSKFRLEPKSSLPLVFGNKGELTKFHASLTALGSCIADPVEIQMIYKMGYFGKGSLSKSQPSFGRMQHGAPPVTRKRQWERRQQWIGDFRKLSDETFQRDSAKLESSRTAAAAVARSGNQKQDAELERGNQDYDEATKEDQMSSCMELTNDDQTDMETERVVLELDCSTEDEDVVSSGASINDDHDSNYYSNKDYLSSEKYNVFAQRSNQQAYHRNEDGNSSQGQVLVLSDSDSEPCDDYLINVKPEIKYESFPVREALHLTAEETFFLAYGLGCLRIMDFDDKFMSIGQTWQYFCREQKCFLQKYVAYHYFRSKGWIVKPGLSYGGDYLLYKEGPPFYHSSYIVIIDVLDAITCKRIDSKSVRNMTWSNFIGLQRLAETVRKEVLIAQILWPSSAVPIATAATDSTCLAASPEVLSQFTVKEILVRRWKASIDTFGSSSSSGADEYSDQDYQ